MKKIINRLLIALALHAGLISISFATDVGGIISSDVTWTADNSPYNLTSNIQVAYGATLTIEPGTSVNGNKLQIWGTLNAIGSKNAPIQFHNILIEGKGGLEQPHNIKIQYAALLSKSSFQPITKRVST